MKFFYKVLLTVTLFSCGPIFSKYFGDSPLMKAIEEKERASVIKHMIANGADVNEVDCEFLRCLKPVLRYALDRGTDKESVEIIKTLIEAGANVNEITYNRIPDRRVCGMMPLLTYATIYSSAEVVQMLVDAGAQDKTAENGLAFKKTALAIAQELGKDGVVKVLTRVK